MTPWIPTEKPQMSDVDLVRAWLNRQPFDVENVDTHLVARGDGGGSTRQGRVPCF